VLIGRAWRAGADAEDDVALLLARCARDGAGAGAWPFWSTDQPGDRRPHCEHFRKIAPGSHDTPKL